MLLSEIDRKLLQHLNNNSRTSRSDVARDLNISREVVEYHITKLEDEGIIKDYITRINQSLFCQGIATLLLKIGKYNEGNSQNFIKFLKSHNRVNWIAELCGTFDFVVTILFKGSEDLANTTSQITEFIGKDLKEHSLSLYITEYKFDRSGILFDKPLNSKKRIMTFKDDSNKLKIDKDDLTILRVLSSNSRAKNVYIAKKTSISEDMVRLRIKRLEDIGVILGYTIVLDISKLGYEAYYFGLQIEQMTEQNIEKLKSFAYANPYVGFCARTSGRYNIVMSIYAKNRNHFINMLRDIKNEFGPLLLDYEFQLNIAEHKEVFIPEGILRY